MSSAVEGGVVEWSESRFCYACKTTFTMSRRRHHCRRCGESFCNTHSKKRAALPGFKKLQRVCENCASELADGGEAVMTRTTSDSTSVATAMLGQGPVMSPAPTPAPAPAPAPKPPTRRSSVLVTVSVDDDSPSELLGRCMVQLGKVGASTPARLLFWEEADLEIAQQTQRVMGSLSATGAVPEVYGLVPSPESVTTTHSRPWCLATARPSTTLKAFLKGTPDDTSRVAVAKGLLQAVAGLHSKGFVHGSLAPSVFGLDARGRPMLLSLDEVVESGGRLHGLLPRFAPPETAAKAVKVMDRGKGGPPLGRTGVVATEALDVWAVGVIVHSMWSGGTWIVDNVLDGDLPPDSDGRSSPFTTREVDALDTLLALFDGTAEVALPNAMPEAMKDLVAGALAPDPADRPTAHDLLSHTMWPVANGTAAVAVVAAGAGEAAGVGEAAPAAVAPAPSADVVVAPEPAPAPAPAPAPVPPPSAVAAEPEPVQDLAVEDDEEEEEEEDDEDDGGVADDGLPLEPPVVEVPPPDADIAELELHCARLAAQVRVMSGFGTGARVPSLFALLPPENPPTPEWWSAFTPSTWTTLPYRLHVLCEEGCHSVVHPGFPVSPDDVALLASHGRPFLRAQCRVVRAACAAGRLSTLPLPRPQSAAGPARPTAYFDMLLACLTRQYPGDAAPAVFTALDAAVAGLGSASLPDAEEGVEVAGPPPPDSMLATTLARLLPDVPLHHVIRRESGTSAWVSAGYKDASVFRLADAGAGLEAPEGVAEEFMARMQAELKANAREIEDLRHKNFTLEAKLMGGPAGGMMGGPADGPTIHCGYLLKRGGGTSAIGNRGWRERFVVVEAGTLAYFKSEESYKSGKAPLKQRYLTLANYTLDRMEANAAEFKLIPVRAKALAEYRRDPKSKPHCDRFFQFKVPNVSFKRFWLEGIAKYVQVQRK